MNIALVPLRQLVPPRQLVPLRRLLIVALIAGCRSREPEALPAVACAPAPAPTSAPFYALTSAKRPSVAALTELGRTLFRDPALSASGKLACAGCHDPAHAYAPANDLAIQPGGRDGKQVGFRATPSLRYLQTVQRFTEHHTDAEGDELDQGPAGGFMWDGRAATSHEQARLPLFSPAEMANRSEAELAAKLRHGYAAALSELFGDPALATDQATVNAATLALEVFQQSPTELYPYRSKYDDYLRGIAKLTAREARGLALFESPAKGNCASCHPSRAKDGGFPAFSDFGFVAVGVPRARSLPANADPKFYDLGLCGPVRTDLASRDQYCGMFRTPSLRNVAHRRRLFHNGSFTSLVDAVRFYATRDVQPERWYPHGEAFDDLPERYRNNVNRDPPFGGQPGGKPALTDAEIADVVAFLETLSDEGQTTKLTIAK